MSQLVARGEKPAHYYGHDSEDPVALLPRPLGRVLDAGCSEGAVGREMRRNGAASLSAIEINPAAAAEARDVSDEVVIGDNRAPGGCRGCLSARTRPGRCWLAKGGRG